MIGASIHQVVKEGRKRHQNANKTGKRISNGFQPHPIVFYMLKIISLHDSLAHLTIVQLSLAMLCCGLVVR